MEVIQRGATLVSLQKNGQELLLAHKSKAAWESSEDYMNVIIGRFANRINGARFPLEGREIKLTSNAGPHQIHGGPNSLNTKLWEFEETAVDRVRMTAFSADGECGFPGNLKVSVTYTLGSDSLLTEFEAESDKATVFAPTSHLYFCFQRGADVRNARLMVHASSCLELDSYRFPTGRILPLDGQMDFRQMRTIGTELDDCFLTDGEEQAVLEYAGMTMILSSDLPGLQVYTGGALSGDVQPYEGIALEPEFWPDCVNHPEWPQPLLYPGEQFHRYIRYQFKNSIE